MSKRQHEHTRAWFAYSVLFLFALSIIFAGVSFAVASIAASRAQKAEVTIKELCMSNNEFRKAQIGLWNYRLDQPPIEDLTPSQQQERDQEIATFKIYVSQAFAPRNCSEITKEGP